MFTSVVRSALKTSAVCQKESISNPTFENRAFYVGHYTKIPRRIALPQILRLAQLVRNSMHFIETKIELLTLHEPPYPGLYSNPDYSSNILTPFH